MDGVPSRFEGVNPQYFGSFGDLFRHRQGFPASGIPEQLDSSAGRQAFHSDFGAGGSPPLLQKKPRRGRWSDSEGVIRGTLQKVDSLITAPIIVVDIPAPHRHPQGVGSVVVQGDGDGFVDCSGAAVVADEVAAGKLAPGTPAAGMEGQIAPLPPIGIRGEGTHNAHFRVETGSVGVVLQPDRHPVHIQGKPDTQGVSADVVADLLDARGTGD